MVRLVRLDPTSKVQKSFEVSLVQLNYSFGLVRVIGEVGEWGKCGGLQVIDRKKDMALLTVVQRLRTNYKEFQTKQYGLYLYSP